MRIDRCVCYSVTFERMRDHCASRPGSTFADLNEEFGCGDGCGLCEPYVRRMLRTGQVVFHQVVTKLDEPARD